MRAHRLLVLVALAAAGAAGACKEATKPPRVASVEVMGSNGALLVGDSVQLTAGPRDEHNNVLEGRSVTWSSSDISVATVSAGLVRGVRGGIATVSATIDGVTGSLALTVGNPTPTISALSPDTVLVGSAPFKLAVTGSGFVPASVVVWNGQDRPTQYLNATTLSASITAADVDSVGSFDVTVRNPQPGGGTSPTGVASVTVRPVPAAYALGADYHATSSDFFRDCFLMYYDTGSVRAVVQAQLRGMAAAGADVVKTVLWFVGTDQNPRDSFTHHFPLTATEVTNIKEYVTDVAAVRTRVGKPLRVQLGFMYLWCADYTTGDPATTVGQCGLDWPTFLAYTKQSVAAVMQAVAPITAADGTPIVERVYLDGEVMIEAKKNQERFLLDLYPWFVKSAADLGLEGSIYFNISDEESAYFDDGFRDVNYPAIDGHRSMFWLYRSVNFLRSHGLPVPKLLTFSLYVKRDQNHSMNDIVRRVFDDYTAVFPGLHAGLAESLYPADATTRREFGRAYAAEYFRRGILDEVLFWTTPYTADVGISIGYPFAFGDFR